jgi:hypothetical protein
MVLGMLLDIEAPFYRRGNWEEQTAHFSIGGWHLRTTGKGVVGEFENQVPSAAKAAIDFVALTARLKPHPF